MIRPQLDLQVKSTSLIEQVGETIPYDLELKNYNELRERTMVPRILVLVLLPKDMKDWYVHTEQQLVLLRCGYWLSLEDREATSNTSTVRLHIPSANQFGPAQLVNLLKEYQKRLAS